MAWKAGPRPSFPGDRGRWWRDALGDHQRARGELERLGKKITDLPWTWSGRGDALSIVQQVRGQCNLPAL